MSLQQDSEHSGSHPAAVPVGFAGKPASSHGPKTVVNIERRPMLPADSHELPPAALAKRRRLFPNDDIGSGEGSGIGAPPLGPAGVKLAHFVVEEPIGRGGMGAVYRAVDQRLERVVALKVLSPEQSQTQNAVQRFLNEARASAQLDHDNIARVFYVGEDDGLHFIAYEYVTGTNIRDLIQRGGRLDPAEAINYTLQIAAALKHTSAAGVVHRDVKPSNIIVTPVGRAKLVDLGLARKEYSESVDELTVAGTTLGTFDYISPEQAKDPRNVDVRSDIYSLGCTLYQMLTGEPPYPEGTMYQKLLKHDGKAPPDPARKNSRVPPELSAVVRKMMSSDPQRRHRNADDLIGDLMAVAGQLGIRTVSPDGLVWAAEMTRRPAGFLRRHFGWMATAAALVVIVFLLDRFGDNVNLQRGNFGANAEGQPAPVAEGDDANATSDLVASTRTSFPEGMRPLPGDNGHFGQDNPRTEGPPGNVGTPAITPRPIELPTADSAPSAAGSAEPVVQQTTSPDSTGPKTQPGDTTGGATTGDSNPHGSDTSKPAAASGTRPIVAADNSPPLPKAEAFPPGVEQQPQIVLATPGNADAKSYNTLEAACHDAEDGSVIVLRYNGTRPGDEKPLRFVDKRITIRGEKGFRPVIAFRPVEDSAGEMPTRLITLIGGFRTSVEMINVDIQVVLPENVDASLEWTLFSLQGAEQVRLNDVRVTFDNAAERAPASLIELTSGPNTNLADMNMMKEKPPGARSEFDIKLTDAFVRGGCDLFRVAHTRPGRFSIERSVIAVDGTLLSVVGDLEMPDDDADLELQMEHITGLLGNGLIHWSTGGDPRDVLPVHVTSRNNIFSTNADRPLIAMDGNTDPDDLRKLLRWSGERNFYDRFVLYWTVSSDLETAETTPFDFTRWNSFWGGGTELDPHGEPVTWKSAWWKKQYVELTAEDLRLDVDAPDNPAVGGALNGSNAGADLLELIPAPQAEENRQPKAEPGKRSD